MPLFLRETDECESCDCDETANVDKSSADITAFDHIDIFVVEMVEDQFFEEPQLFISAK